MLPASLLQLPKLRHPSTYLVVIINEADTMTRDAQAALRRTMEKYMSNMRIILCANSTSKLIAPIKSRCLLIRVAAPSEDEVTRSLHPACERQLTGYTDCKRVTVRCQQAAIQINRRRGRTRHRTRLER